MRGQGPCEGRVEEQAPPENGERLARLRRKRDWRAHGRVRGVILEGEEELRK